MGSVDGSVTSLVVDVEVDDTVSSIVDIKFSAFLSQTFPRSGHKIDFVFGCQRNAN